MQNYIRMCATIGGKKNLGMYLAPPVTGWASFTNWVGEMHTRKMKNLTKWGGKAAKQMEKTCSAGWNIHIRTSHQLCITNHWKHPKKKGQFKRGLDNLQDRRQKIFTKARYVLGSSRKQREGGLCLKRRQSQEDTTQMTGGSYRVSGGYKMKYKNVKQESQKGGELKFHWVIKEAHRKCVYEKWHTAEEKENTLKEKKTIGFSGWGRKNWNGPGKWCLGGVIWIKRGKSLGEGGKGERPKRGQGWGFQQRARAIRSKEITVQSRGESQGEGKWGTNMGGVGGGGRGGMIWGFKEKIRRGEKIWSNI